MRRILRTLLSCVLLGALCLAPVPPANAAKSEITHLMYADIAPAADYTYRVENAAVAEDGTLLITVSFLASGGGSRVAPSAFITMTRDKDHNATYYDPIAAYADGIRLSEEAPFALTKGVRQEITWQFKDPGPKEKLIYFVYMEDPGVFYECQCLFNRPVPYVPPTPAPSDGFRTASAPFPSSKPTPIATSGKARCSACSFGSIDCRLCRGSGGEYVTKYRYGYRNDNIWEDCIRCHGSGKEECSTCKGSGWVYN